MRGVTEHQSEFQNNLQISTHTPHARRDFKGWVCRTTDKISTHTPHARRDVVKYVKYI